MTIAAIAFGGNQGDVSAHYVEARLRLNDSGATVLATSSLYDTTPIGASAGGTFQNGAFIVDTNQSARELLHKLQTVETALGRVRTTHWGARTVDLDLILFGDEVCQTAKLTLPHPACWFRRFVLDPLCEIAPQLRHPVAQRSVWELQQALLLRPMTYQLFGLPAPLKDRLEHALQSRFGESIATLNIDDSPAVIPFRMVGSQPESCRSNATEGVANGSPILTVPLTISHNDPQSWDQLWDDVSQVLTAALDEPERLPSPSTR